MENDASRLPAASFVDACAALKQLCGDSVDWQWTDAPTAGPHQARRTGWLVLKQRLQLPCGALPEQGLETREADAAAAADDPGALSVSGASSPSHHWYSLCVVHNSVYCVPQLLFRGCTAEGSPLSWPAVLSDLARNSANQLLADSVSPWIHPVTGEEWMTLHPCNTRSFLGLMLASDAPPTPTLACPGEDSRGWLVRYMRAWWSVAGAAVGAPPLLLDADHACK